MEGWREVLVAYQPVLYFFDGLTFFVLGLSIIFLARRSRRLAIARAMPLLAAFALCRSAVTWDQALGATLDRSLLLPPIAHVALVGASASLLLAFGIHTLLGTRRWRAELLVGSVFLLWMIGMMAAHYLGRVPFSEALLYGEIIYRYTILFPGAVLSAVGLHRLSLRTLDPETLPYVRDYLAVAEIALAAFGVLSGLLPPRATWWPPQWLNEELGTHGLLVPITILRAMTGLTMLLGIGQTLRFLYAEVMHWVEGVEQNLALVTDRERIGRELHDGIIQSIYAAGLMLEGVQQSLYVDPPESQYQLTRAMTALNHTIQDIRRYIFDLRGDLPDDDLETGFRKLLRDFHVNTLLETDLQVEGEPDRRGLTVERRRHIFQITREALTNVARHAQARNVYVKLSYRPNDIMLSVWDDGVGMTALPASGNGQGLRNIRERARLLDGSIEISAAAGQGLKLTLTVPR